MKKIEIKHIRLVNFKGVRSFEMDFNKKVTSIYGANASGKTTVFDAFTWLLFGKNCEDKKQFGIKTLDNAGNVIQRIPHEVTATISVNGEDMTLTRTLNEKWQKRRGSAEEEFKGNEETRLYNDVPLSVRDWNEKIDAICTEETFKMITNPLYFTSLKWDKQREMLIRMAGDVTTDDVIKTDPEQFGKLIADMRGKTFEEFKKEIGAKKRRIKDEIETLPSRIDERKRDNVQTYDWQLIDARLHHKEKKLKEIDTQLADNAQLTLKANDDAVRKAEEYGKLQLSISKKRNDIISAIRLKEFEAEHKQEQRREELNTIKERIARSEAVQSDLQKQLIEYRGQREQLIAEWRKIKSENLQFSENDFVCPTCGHPLDVDQIESKQKEMEQRFNERKSQELETNKRKGLAVKSQIERIENNIAIETNNVETLRMKQTSIEKALKSNNPVILTDEELETIVMNDPEIARLNAQLAKTERPTTEPTANNDDKDNDTIKRLTDERNQLREEIAQMREQLATKTIADANQKRIAELEEQLRNQSEELAKLEGTEYAMQQFTKTRISLLEDKINAMFSFVKFRMFETQINGGEVETCKAMVDGVPYDDLNNAMRINAGLDIINAICEKMGITAPIFADNAESVNELIPTNSQLVRLVVSEDKELKIA